jgi:hypothetical protein
LISSVAGADEATESAVTMASAQRQGRLIRGFMNIEGC